MNRVLSVILILDLSASVNHFRVASDPIFRDIIDAFASRVSADDQVAVASLTSLTRFSPFVNSPAAIKTAATAVLQVADRDRFGPSPIWDALYDGVTRLQTLPGQRALVLVSDGKASGNVHGTSELISVAKAAHVAIHVVIENAPLLAPGPASPPDPSALLQMIARETGGLALADRPRMPRDRTEAIRVGTIMDKIREGGRP